ncbi:hypothetical protein [Oceanipulchritudo coccoides]|uniref:hypothetical protein n=1 Tax=Oceanipulchritudo coccoides TaxID=2706888 RepID=UPI001EE9268B|nr:hypothetical protein [Oceanipulchritudo coccoides]
MSLVSGSDYNVGTTTFGTGPVYRYINTLQVDQSGKGIDQSPTLVFVTGLAVNQPPNDQTLCHAPEVAKTGAARQYDIYG